MTLHREGYKYIIIATILWAAISFGINLLHITWLTGAVSFICFALWFWVVAFFRLPSRTMTFGDDKIICPADGKVVVIEEAVETEYFKDKRLQVSVFMSPINVHINRNPISGVIQYLRYHPGKYLVAWHPKSSTENERTTIVIKGQKNEILMRQIAGALARRICYYVKEQQPVKQNDEFGFIRFGSRVDLYLPIGTKIDVKIGDVVKGGVTVIGRW